MAWYAWPSGDAWQPEQNPDIAEVSRRVQAWEYERFGTRLCSIYDPAYLVGVFLTDTDDPDFLCLSARFAYVVFTLDTLLEDEPFASEEQLGHVLEVFAQTVCEGSTGPSVMLPSARLRLYQRELARVWAELVRRCPSQAHVHALRETVVTYFRESILLEREIRARGSEFTLAEYERFRPYTIQTIMGFDVIALDHELDHDALALLGDLRHAASLLTGVVNDVTSFPRERCEATNVNLVCWAMREHGLDETGALHWVVAYAGRLIERCQVWLERLAEQAPRLLPLAQAWVKAAVGECMYFHTAARYRNQAA